MSLLHPSLYFNNHFLKINLQIFTYSTPFSPMTKSYTFYMFKLLISYFILFFDKVGMGYLYVDKKTHIIQNNVLEFHNI